MPMKISRVAVTGLTFSITLAVGVSEHALGSATPNFERALMHDFPDPVSSSSAVVPAPTAKLLEEAVSFDVAYVETVFNWILTKWEAPDLSKPCYAHATFITATMKLVSINCLYPCSSGCEVCITTRPTGFTWNCACSDVGCP